MIYRFDSAITPVAEAEALAVSATLTSRGHPSTVTPLTKFPRGYKREPLYILDAPGVKWAELLPLIVEQIEARAK